MKKPNQRFVLLTQNPALAEACKSAWTADRCHLVELPDTGLLSPLLDRGVDLVALDLSLPAPALENCAVALSRHRELPLLLLGSPAPWHAVSRGNPLEEVLAPPFAVERLQQAVALLLEKSQMLYGRLVGRSEATQELRERILRLAPTSVTVLLTGETGTGKEEVGRALHQLSPRRDRPFKAINCAAIPENLLENELFGHERGAYTDARTQHQGLFEQAEGGTVFLDEIGEMSRAAQVRLLRVLEEREVTRIGGTAAIPVDVRVVAATNRDLQQAMARGEFRRDLYHRLKIAELALPPLRQRREDVALLIEYFVEEFAPQRQTPFAGFTAAALELLGEYDWPGNVRELRNLVEHLVFLGPQGQVEPHHLLPHLERMPPLERPLPVPAPRGTDQTERELIYFALLDLKREVSELRRLVEERLAGPPPPLSRPVYPVEEPEVKPAEPPEAGAAVRSLRDLEEEAIAQALRAAMGNRRQAAQLLGIGVRTLYRKLDEYHLK
ncbi:MAG: sigma-54-dependent Fis family transcriptional regulator [Candidatus Handelsmanbacteria bacterium]|nr:sigma-54-dependent Fis family transcriptional regulator [Candidatus Handelsmanbacteria bacterium]